MAEIRSRSRLNLHHQIQVFGFYFSQSISTLGLIPDQWLRFLIHAKAIYTLRSRYLTKILFQSMAWMSLWEKTWAQVGAPPNLALTPPKFGVSSKIAPSTKCMTSTLEAPLNKQRLSIFGGALLNSGRPLHQLAPPLYFGGASICSALLTIRRPPLNQLGALHSSAFIFVLGRPHYFGGTTFQQWFWWRFKPLAPPLMRVLTWTWPSQVGASLFLPSNLALTIAFPPL